MVKVRKNKADWIWLNNNKSLKEEHGPISVFSDNNEDYPYQVVEFRKKYDFSQLVKRVTVNICADVKFWLYVNDKYVGAGPVCSGGDFGVIIPMPKQYYNTYEIDVGGTELNFYVMVQNKPSELCDMSMGKNGLWVLTEAELEDGSKACCGTDDTWEARVNAAYTDRYCYDFTRESVQWGKAELTESVWNLTKPQIPMLTEEEVLLEDFSPVTVMPGEIKEVSFTFDKIYSIYHLLEVEGDTFWKITLTHFEREGYGLPQDSEIISGSGSLSYRSLNLYSSGGMHMKLENTGAHPLRLNKVSGSFVHYPVGAEGSFSCSEETFTKIYNMGKHALKICRQSIELDSPKHQENLGCAGDYAIASLMNYYTYGDARLTRLDIVRIADSLRVQDGYMFHTTYSLIWIIMVYDYYQYTGDVSILSEVWDAICLVFQKMQSSANEKGMIDHPESYMFVDWLVVDEISMHHPPMALGQAVLNAFYHGGLLYAMKIGQVIGEDTAIQCELYRKTAEKLRTAFHETFFDEEKGLYFDGCNENHETNRWLPENVDKRYFSWHTNSLAVLYDLAPKTEHKCILRQILGDMSLINPQPYFMHFVLEAIYKAGLFEECGIPQLMRWKEMTGFEKGLQEGWYDMSGYGFDYSHVWGGTPTYQLPSKLSGLEMIEAGFRKIKLQPRLYGLEWAKMEIPTPYGMISIDMRQGREPVITVPDGIDVVTGG